jgi:hypothetical protein
LAFASLPAAAITLLQAAPAHATNNSESVHGNALQIGLGLTQH